MKRSNRLVILVGVLLAVLAFVGIVVLLNQRPSGTTPPAEQNVRVVVAKQDIAIDTPITPDMVETTEVPAEAVQEGALRDPSQVGGRPAVVAVPAGAQITVGTFGEAGIVDLNAALNAGERAIAFQVDRVTGLDFLIKGGDTIDIVLAQQISVLQPTADSLPEAPRFEVVTGLENQRTVKVVLQNKRVLYVSQTRTAPVTPPAGEPTPAPGEQPTTPQIDSVIIVFAGTDEDAEVIKFAQRDLGEIGSLSAIVRRTDDDAATSTRGITLDQLVANYGLRIPDIIQQLTGP